MLFGIVPKERSRFSKVTLFETNATLFMSASERVFQNVEYDEEELRDGARVETQSETSMDI